MSLVERHVAVPTMADLARAHDAVRAHLEPTPVVETRAASNAVLKLECWQPTGSFKVRGAIAALSALSEQDRAAGVVTASAGNHGLGVAFAATRLGVPATVVVPATASPAKVAALREFPIRLVQKGDGYFAAELHALELAAGGATYVSPYNDSAVIAGQASIAAEIRQQVDGPITIVAPVGGGGLVAGLCLWAAGDSEVGGAVGSVEMVRVVGVEAGASQVVSAAVAARRVVEVTVSPTLADGLAGNIEPNSVTPGIIAAHCHALTTVTELEIRGAMRFLAAEHGLLVEGSGAVAVAALLAGRVSVIGSPVVVVTGRNISLPTAAEVLGSAARSQTTSGCPACTGPMR
jgi:threonine dehydratase